MVEYLLPVRIVDSKNVINQESFFVPKGLYSFHEGVPANFYKYAQMKGKGAYIIFDFGKEMCGGARFQTVCFASINARVRLRFGESITEVSSEIGDKGASNDHSPRDFDYRLSFSGDYSCGNTGFRFLRIDLLEEGNITFRNVYCINNILKRKTIYEYKGKDQRIRDIFVAAKRTIDLCSSSGYIWDGIKRDRLIWVGDMAPEVMALTTLYGPISEINKSLDLTKKLYPIPRYMNEMIPYSMWWAIIVSDYYKDFKNVNYIKKHVHYVERLVKQFSALVDEEGNILERMFVDWPTVGSEDEAVGARSIFLMFMDKAIYLLKEFNKDTKLAEDIKRRLLLKEMKVTKMKQVVALKYFATGKMSDEEYALLIKDGARGFSTFMSYYILTAIASRDEKLAIELMKEYYGAMLDKGATTFFEDFDMDWVEGSGRIDEINPNLKDIHGDYGKHCYVGFRHSLCHGWSSGVIKFIKEHCK